MILANKQPGETMGEVVQRVSSSLPSPTPLTYAGRLDPLAEGLVILLTKEELPQKQEILSLNKTYHLTILFGVTTDTYDPLGMPTAYHLPAIFTKQQLRQTLAKLKNLTSLPYPPYSSKTVNGQPLWQLAKNNQLPPNLPTKKITLHQLKVLGIEIPRLQKAITPKLNLIKQISGDFRQDQILKAWHSLLKTHGHKKVTLAHLTISCSSGTYMRTLAHLAGLYLDSFALAFHIKRTAIGSYTLDTL